MLAEHKRLEEEIASVEAQLRELPDGKLICARNGARYKWYSSDGQNQTYIPKRNRKLAEQLALKKYLTSLLADLQHEKDAIEKYLRCHNTHISKTESMLTEIPEYHSLLSPHFKPLSQELHEWMTSPYERNPKHCEQLVHKTISGNQVRSKSESLIDTILHINKIPFRYECALLLGETLLYPDFTIRHPRTGKFFYWEHFGLMDNTEYCKNTFSKLQLYSSHNIIPDIQLITTFETQHNPLDADKITNIVKEFFG